MELLMPLFVVHLDQTNPQYTLNVITLRSTTTAQASADDEEQCWMLPCALDRIGATASTETIVCIAACGTTGVGGAAAKLFVQLQASRNHEGVRRD